MHRPSRRRALGLLGLGGLGLAAQASTAPEPPLEAVIEAAAALPAAPPEVVRGMTVSCPTWGWEWGTEAMVRSMARLKELGCNWIAIHPYASIAEDGSLRWRPLDPAPEWLLRPAEAAHRLGMKLLLKPHLAYWGTRWDWRGAITLDEAGFDRFWAGYPGWIRALLAACPGADALVVATEVEGLLSAPREDRWRSLVQELRAARPIPLTWAANWDRAEALSFWSDFDVVGIQGYFPVLRPEELPVEGPPAQDLLDAGWRRILARLEALAGASGRRILLTELGYNRWQQAPIEPWSTRSGGPDAAEVQARCLQAALSALDRSGPVAGAFLWKWFPGEVARGDFRMSDEHMTRVIRARWRG